MLANLFREILELHDSLRKHSLSQGIEFFVDYETRLFSKNVATCYFQGLSHTRMDGEIPFSVGKQENQKTSEMIFEACFIYYVLGQHCL